MNIKTAITKQFKLGTVIKDEAKTVTIHLNLPIFGEYSIQNLVALVVYSDVVVSGAGKLNRTEFIKAQNELGANISVGNTNTDLNITLTTPAQNLKKSLELLKLVLTKPTLAEAEIKRAKTTYANILELEKDNARGIALANFRNVFSKEGEPNFIFGIEKLKLAATKVNKKTLAAIAKNIFSNQATLTIGGDTNSVTYAVSTLSKVFPSSAKANLNTTATFRGVDNRVIKIESVPSKQNIELSIGAPLPLTTNHEDMTAFLFGLAVLGRWGGFVGRLMSTVREKEGLTYAIYARTEAITVNKLGYWRIFTYFAPKDVKQGISSTLREVETIIKKGITDSEWKRFKTILRTSETLTYDSLSNTTATVHNCLVSGLTWDEFKTLLAKQDVVTKAEINSALKKYLDPNKIIISAAGPVKGVEADIKSFAN